MKILLPLLLLLPLTSCTIKESPIFSNKEQDRFEAQLLELKTLSSRMSDTAHDNKILENFNVEVSNKINVGKISLKELEELYSNTLSQLKTDNGKRELVWMQMSALEFVKE